MVSVKVDQQESSKFKEHSNQKQRKQKVVTNRPHPPIHLKQRRQYPHPHRPPPLPPLNTIPHLVIQRHILQTYQLPL